MAETEKKYIKHIQLDPTDATKKYQIKDIEAADTPITDTFILNLFNPDAQAADE